MRKHIQRWLKWNQPEEIGEERWFKSCLRRYLLWNNNWYGSHAIRYLPIARFIRRFPNWESIRIIEIGSGDFGITPFLKRHVVTVDLKFDTENLRRANGLPKPVIGKADLLPFKDGAFDIAVVVDVFEHLENPVREIVSREMLRVTKDYLIAAFPCGEEAKWMDRLMDFFHLYRFGVRNKWLVEHDKFDLPHVERMFKIFRDIVPNSRISVVTNGPISICLFLEVMEIFFPRNYLRRVLTGWLAYLASLSIYTRSYRKIFYVDMLPETDSRVSKSDEIHWTNIELKDFSYVRYRSGFPEGLLSRSKNSDMILLSVIIPTMDADREGRFKYLQKQIRLQSFQKYELIVIKGDRRQGRAINAAAAIAQGKYLLTLDDDTALPNPNTFETLYEFMELNPDVGIAGGNNIIPENAPPFVTRAMKEIPRRSWKPVKKVVDSDLAEHPCMIMRADIFRAVGGENELLPRGLDPYLREMFRRLGKRVVLVPGVFYHHLPPDNLKSLLRQFHRNGRQAAYVNRHYPQWVFETPDHHGQFLIQVPLPFRIIRFPVRLFAALIRGRFVFFVSEIAYLIGFLQEWLYGGKVLKPGR